MTPHASRAPLRRGFLLVSAIGALCVPSFSAETRVVDLAAGVPAAPPSVLRHAVSADGRFVAFTSDAGGLVPGAGAGPHRVYLRDMELGVTVLASRTSAGGIPLVGSSLLGSISSDGRFVVFSSSEALTPNAPPGFVECAYLFDRLTGAVELVSLSETGVASRGSFGATSRASLVTPDGRYVLFESPDPLTSDAGPSTTVARVYRRDRVAQQTILISPAPQGADPPSGHPAGITADGSRMLYQCVGTNGSVPMPGVFVRDLVAALDVRVDVDAGSLPLAGVVGSTLDWTADGESIVAWSAAANPSIGDVDDSADVYLIRWTIPAVEVVSRTQSGQHATAPCSRPTISDDGRYVAFEAAGADVVPWDQNGAVRDVVVRDLLTQRNAIVNVSNLGAQSTDFECSDPIVSGDGGSVVFVSASATLVPGAGGKHYFHRDRIGFTKLGYGKAGSSHFTPQLNGMGSTEPGGSGTLFLNNGSVFAQSLLFVALDRAYLAPISGPFKGTVLVTAAPVFSVVIPIDAFGQFFVNYTLPSNLSYPPEVYLQCAMPDPLAINGVAVSSALLMGL